MIKHFVSFFSFISFPILSSSFPTINHIHHTPTVTMAGSTMTNAVRIERLLEMIASLDAAGMRVGCDWRSR